MQPLIKRIKELETKVDAALARLHIEGKKADIEALEAELATPEIGIILRMPKV